MFETEAASNLSQGGTDLPGQERHDTAFVDLFPTHRSSLHNPHSLVADLAADLFQIPDQHSLANSLDCLIEGDSATRLQVAPIAEAARLSSNDDSYDEITGEHTATYIKPATETKKAELLIQGGETSNTEKEEVNSAISEGRFNRDSQPISKQRSDRGAGNTAEEAKELGRLGYRDQVAVNGKLNTEDSGSKNEFFQFNTSKTGTYEIKLEELGGNTDITIYNEKGKAITSSNNQGTQSELITVQLDKGSYHIKVHTKESTDNNYKLSIEGLGNEREQAISALIKDKSIKNAALNSIKYDSNFSREDLIGILRSAGDERIVTQQELTDLKNFWHQHLSEDAEVRDDCKRLSQKVIFGDKSNTWYTGKDNIRASLGNLKAGSSAQGLNLLIGKHFLGTDRPAIRTKHISTASYSRAGGELFKDGISTEDVKQGKLGTCYVLASLAGYAQKQPKAIENIFHDNGDGTWTVRIYQNDKADYVTVDRQLPTDHLSGNFIYASSPENGKTSSNKNELWVALYEKAYAQMNESGQIEQDGQNHFQGIAYGDMVDSIEHINNEHTKEAKTSHLSKNDLISLVDSDEIVTFAFDQPVATDPRHGDPTLSNATPNHAYVVTQYDRASKLFHLFNPWGKEHLNLTFEQLQLLKGTVEHSYQKAA